MMLDLCGLYTHSTAVYVRDAYPNAAYTICGQSNVFSSSWVWGGSKRTQSEYVPVGCVPLPSDAWMPEEAEV
eukprot:scaffold147320_cov19-Tisochrysis_lutea.AAC.2